jgi:hypothetical protein
VSESGETEIVPAAANPLPTPWSIWTLVALVTFQISVVESPSVMSVSAAENATMVGALEVVVVPAQAGRISAKPLIRTSTEANKDSFFIYTSKDYM